MLCCHTLDSLYAEKCHATTCRWTRSNRIGHSWKKGPLVVTNGRGILFSWRIMLEGMILGLEYSPKDLYSSLPESCSALTLARIHGEV